VKSIAGFWTLLAELPTEERAGRLIQKLKDPKTFGLENPFPTLSGDEPGFDER
jgi:hypothetical protein